MTRRHFFPTLGLTLSWPLAGSIPSLFFHQKSSAMKKLPAAWQAENDARVGRLLERQERREGHPYFGGLPNSHAIYTPMGTAAMLQHYAVAYGSSDSRYFGVEAIALAMERAAGCLLRMQHDDGTVDLYSTNFHSTPDLAFVTEPLCLAYALLQRKKLPAVREALQTFLLRAGEALRVGGIHTPNHRWVVCMALARLHRLFPNEPYLKRIDEWLREKIDIDPDGQYTEKSTHVYSPLTNRCLITMARLLDRPALYEPVRRNLDMTLYYLHPNGEIVTEASGRQDQYRIGYPTPYYYAYRFMALRDAQPRYAAMVRLIESTATDAQLSQNLAYFLEDPSLSEALPAPAPLPDNYRRHFPYSQLVRIRRRSIDATVLAGNFSFFTFSHGAAVLQAVRLAGAFFGKGQFKADSIQTMDEAVVLRQELEGPYYQPFPFEELPDDGDWEKMPREKRPTSEVQYLRSVVKVSEVENGFALDFDISGTEDVPLAVELGFRPGGELSGVEEVPGIPMAYYLKKGEGSYRFEDDVIEFGPGLHGHGWTEIRGAEDKMEAMSVYLTGVTPFQFRLAIKKGG